MNFFIWEPSNLACIFLPVGVPQQKPRTEATSLLTQGASKKRHDHETLKLQPSVRCRKPTLHASWLAAVGQIQKMKWKSAVRMGERGLEGFYLG